MKKNIDQINLTHLLLMGVAVLFFGFYHVENPAVAHLISVVIFGLLVVLNIIPAVYILRKYRRKAWETIAIIFFSLGQMMLYLTLLFEKNYPNTLLSTIFVFLFISNLCQRRVLARKSVKGTSDDV